MQPGMRLHFALSFHPSVSTGVWRAHHFVKHRKIRTVLRLGQLAVSMLQPTGFASVMGNWEAVGVMWHWEAPGDMCYLGAASNTWGN